MLEKQAIQQVPDSTGQFIIPLFLVDKRGKEPTSYLVFKSTGIHSHRECSNYISVSTGLQECYLPV